MNAETSLSPADAIYAEHQQLEQKASDLRALLTETFDWLILDQALAALQECTLNHFELEETGGYLTNVAEKSPNSQPQIDRLLAEHEQMQQELHKVRRMAAYRRERGEVKRALENWLDLLHEHEQRENLLAIDVFNTDIGGGD